MPDIICPHCGAVLENDQNLPPDSEVHCPSCRKYFYIPFPPELQPIVEQLAAQQRQLQAQQQQQANSSNLLLVILLLLLGVPTGGITIFILFALIFGRPNRPKPRMQQEHPVLWFLLMTVLGIMGFLLLTTALVLLADRFMN